MSAQLTQQDHFPLLLAAAPLKQSEDPTRRCVAADHFPLLLAAAPLKLRCGQRMRQAT